MSPWGEIVVVGQLVPFFERRRRLLILAAESQLVVVPFGMGGVMRFAVGVAMVLLNGCGPHPTSTPPSQLPCSDTDCANYTSRSEAQRDFDADRVCRQDLDADKDSIACEEPGNTVFGGVATGGGGGSSTGVGGGTGGSSSGCPTTGACGCSGLNKASCGGACCSWATGSGCGCR